MTAADLTVVLGTYIEEDLVKRIEAAQPSVRVIYEPDLLPVPRYPCDHGGTRRDLSDADVRRWHDLVAQADIYFDFDWLDAPGMPERSPGLRWIQATSAGIGGYMERTGLSQSGITVTTAGGIHAIPLSEFALMGALHFVKGIPLLRQRQQAHHWERYTNRQLAGMRALVVGLGGIGRAVVAAFSGAGVEVWGLGRDGRSYDDIAGLTRLVYRADLDRALPEADILVICCPLTPQTEGLVGARQVSLLKPGAVVVNVGRGQIIDQLALLAALTENRIAGACLDVFAVEPLPADDPLWALENVIISPHSASTVAVENQKLVDLFLDNLDRFRADAPLRNLYDPVRGY